jgi:hypothetical protein
VPSAGASILVPFTISWSAVSDPSGIVAYNWEFSPSASFVPGVLQNSTSGQTQNTLGGLSNGVWFLRVQALSGAFVQGTWSAAQLQRYRAGPGSPASPILQPTKAYSTFHPFENITFNWSAVPGAVRYVPQFSADPAFPVVTRGQFDNIPNTTMTFEIGNPERNYSARVYAVNASGIAGVPSNVITFSVFFNNPIGPPPSPVSPASGTTLTLPITLSRTDVPNPQPSGYELQIAKNSGFSPIEEDDPQLNGPPRTVLSLTPGTKFWRVRSAQGDNSPPTSAETAWSATGTFTVSTAPPAPVSLTLTNTQLYSGHSTFVQVQLSAAVPANGATIGLTSSNPAAAPVPATTTMPGNTAWTQFQMQTGQVAASTPVTLTATISSVAASTQFNVLPPSLNSLVIAPGTIRGGAQPEGIVMLNGQAPAGGAIVSLSSNSPLVTPPSPVTVLAGDASVSFPITTNTVAASTTATLTAAWKGVSVQSQLVLMPQQPPVSLTLSPTSTVGQSGGSFATVTIASPAALDDTLQVTVSNPAVATMVPGSVTIPAGVTAGGFNIFTVPVSVQTLVTISVTGGGVTLSAVLTLNPAATPAPTLSSLALSPSAVTGGSSSQGTVTLTGAAPSGGAVSASFTVSTGAVAASTSASIAGAFGGASRSAVLTVSPPAASASLSSLAVSPASVVGGGGSGGTVTLTGTAPAGGFTVALSSGNAAARVPASVTVPQGATGASFSITTSIVTASTPVTITASAGTITRTAALTVLPAGQSASLSVTATGRGGERVTSNPAGINVGVGGTMSAAFAGGTGVTLSVTNGRDTVRTGACSSNGNKAKTCAFTVTGNAAVTANVQ